jgi:HlyD family secretion protein
MNTRRNDSSDISIKLGLDNQSAMKKGRNRWGIAAVVSVALIVGLGIWKGSQSSTDLRYKTQEVRRGTITAIVTATGTLQPTNKVDVGSELSGIIKSVEVDYNSTVRVGQILAKLDTTKLEAQVTQSKAALESAKAKILQTKATVSETRSKLAQLRRVKQLSNNRVPSQAEMDAAEAALERALADEESARAAVSQAQATLDGNLTDLSKAVIRSPISGVVLARSVEPGQTVAASFNTPVLFTLAEDLKKMELHVNVDEADIGNIREGQKARFSVAAYANRTFDAQITQSRLGSSTTSGVVTYETVLKVDNSDLLLRPGMTATADITIRNVENVLLVPSAALRFTPPVTEKKRQSSTGFVDSILPRPPSPKAQPRDDNPATMQQRIWTLRDDRLTEIPVTVGASNAGMTEILSDDIRPGMSVVVDLIDVVK